MSICIVTTDLLHIISNGGIGTANYHLSKVLSTNDVDTSILFCDIHNYKVDKNKQVHIIKKYANFGVKLEFLSNKIKYDKFDYWPNHNVLILSYLIYKYLRHKEYKKIIFQDWKGIGMYSMLSKKCGLSFLNTSLITQIHSPELWVAINNNNVIGNKSYPLIQYQMERTSIMYSDQLIHPSKYILQWIKSHGYKTSGTKSLNLKYAFYTCNQNKNTLLNKHKKKSDIHIAFFGRLEERKGLDIFVTALKNNSLVELFQKANVEISFLGKEGVCKGIKSNEFITNSRLRIKYTVHNSFNSSQAISYLKKNNCIAVIASKADNSPLVIYECIAYNIPFIASNTGGIGELIPKSYKRDILFEFNQNSLIDKLYGLIKLKGILRIIPSLDLKEINNDWVNEILKAPKKITKLNNEKSLSICITNFNNHNYLKLTIASIMEQDFKIFEVILIDDCSTDFETKQYLESLRPLFISKNWKIIINNKNLFIGKSRNIAAKHAKYDLILFMDNDNYASNNQISTFLRAYNYSNADAIVSLCYNFTNKHYDKPNKFNSTINHIYLPLGNSPSASIFGNYYGDANMLIKKDVFFDLGGFTTDRDVSYEDWEFFQKLENHNKRIIVIPKKLFWLRTRETSISQITDNKANKDRVLREVYKSLNWSKLDDYTYVSLTENNNGPTGINILKHNSFFSLIVLIKIFVSNPIKSLYKINIKNIKIAINAITKEPPDKIYKNVKKKLNES